jgi:hypothetical protein
MAARRVEMGRFAGESCALHIAPKADAGVNASLAFSVASAFTAAERIAYASFRSLRLA